VSEISPDAAFSQIATHSAIACQFISAKLYLRPMQVRMQIPLKIAVTVSNDLVTDQRVQKVCQSLIDRGHTPFLIGRKLPASPEMPSLPYKTQRLNLGFHTGPAFYAMLNLRLFFRLLFMRCDAIHANDLDTVLPAYLVAKLRGKQLVYDTHEYFTGVPELSNRPLVRKTWKRIERFIFKRVDKLITVNNSIAQLYKKDYGKELRIMRNIPSKTSGFKPAQRSEYGFEEDTFLIILQGNGINKDRGAEEAVEMIKHIEKAVLIIAGSGDVIPELKKYVSGNGLDQKVRFLPRMHYSTLMGITAFCNLGLSFDKDSNINYRFSLPNKLFDYIRAGIPVLATDLPEVSTIILTYKTGLVTNDLSPSNLTQIVEKLRSDKALLQQFKENCRIASLELNWEEEAEILNDWYGKVK